MLAALRFILATLIGVSFGLATAWWAIESVRFDGNRAIGQWTVVDSGGEGNPYAAARAAQRGGLGLAPSEGVQLAAEVDSADHRLDPACTYVVTGPMPTSVLWTLTVSDRDGRLPVNPAGRFGFTSMEALSYGAARQVHISFGPEVRPGDFVATNGLSNLVVTLRLYSPTIISRLPGEEQLPKVTPLGCDRGGRS